MTVRKQIGIIFASAISLLLLAWVFTFALMPHRTRLALAEWNVRRHFLEAVRQLVQDGHTNVFNLEGSIFVWASEGRPLEKQGDAARKVHQTLSVSLKTPLNDGNRPQP